MSDIGLDISNKKISQIFNTIIERLTLLSTFDENKVYNFNDRNLSLFSQTHFNSRYKNDRLVFSHHSKSEKAAPIICYESIYGEYVSEYVRNGANLLAIITNDGWWNNTEGHKQHLSYARLRSIETRKNIVRSANTGISAVINYRGEILRTIGYEQEGLINKNVGMNDKITFYTKYGDYIFRLCLFFIIIISAFYLANLLKVKK